MSKLKNSVPSSPAASNGKRTSSRSAGLPDKGSVPANITAKLDATPVNDLWREYTRSRSETIRNYFWERYNHLVRFIAERTYARLPDEVDINDLVSAGQFGLMDAINAFDLAYNVKFETYCANRIRGAILDELRAMDWVPRLVRVRSAKVAQAVQRFEMRTGRSPTEDELTIELGVDNEEWEKIHRDSKAVGTTSIDRKLFRSDGNKDVTEIDIIKDDTQSNPVIESQRRDLKELLTKGLSRAERLIVTLYYYEELTMKEIGITLDLSESRVSQMHSSILARLKTHMLNRRRELEPMRA
ncbi:MAG: FliA/WhiG family RNA polymerase sigma factor [Phycisphaerales bacterium]|nr:FliA/WhiG family RNA polymerase sigma factor [Phycisphaeraceae bacterium]